jgi:hypothetical protein
LIVQPFDYITQVRDPVQMALAGYTQGQGLLANRQQMAQQQQQMEMQRTLFDQQQQAMQAQQQRGQEMQGALMSIYDRLSDGTLSPEDVFQFQMAFPEAAEEFGAAYEGYTKAQMQGTVAEQSSLIAAVASNPAIAQRMLERQLAAAEASGDEESRVGAQAMLMQLQQDPNALLTGLIVDFASIPGIDKDIVQNVMKAAMPEQFRPLTAEEVDRFRASGFDLQPGQSYQINERTGEVKAFGAERGPLVQMSVGADGAPRPTVFQEAVDKRVADDYAEWVTGGGSDVIKQLDQLDRVKERLDSGEPLTGPILGLVSPQFRVLFNEGSVDAQQLVEEVVQRNLRLILGAQFTEREGERLIARAYNPQASAETNSRRVSALIGQISLAAQQKDALFKHLEQYGTTQGFSGRAPVLNDFFAALEAADQGARRPRARAPSPGAIPQSALSIGITPEQWGRLTPEEKTIFED